MRYLFIGLLLSASVANAQSPAELTVEKIMRDPRWIGTAPSGIAWSPDSKKVYFNWNPENAPADSLYWASPNATTPQKVSRRERLAMPAANAQTNKANTQAVYEKYGDLYLLDIPSGKIRQITNTVGRESAPQFAGDEKKIIFLSEQNIFSWEISTGLFTQLSDFRKGKKGAMPPVSEQEKWLRKDQLDHFDVLNERQSKQDKVRKNQKADQPKRPKEIYLDEQSVDMIRLSPDGKYITYRLTKDAKSKSAIVPNYVTASGFTEDIPARTKVGAPPSASELYLYDISRDTVFQIKTDDVPGIKDKPGYLAEASAKTPDALKDKKADDKKSDRRGINFNTVNWSNDSRYCVVVMRSQDNKDRWIMQLDPATQKLSVLNRQHDDAWIGGPGTASFGEANLGWLADNKNLWFFSEETGFSHLYIIDVSTQKKRAVTQGAFEVQQAQLSHDKNFFYIITNEVHAGEKQLYKVPVTGGKPVRLTTMTGAHEVELSPDEKTIAFRYSYSNKPWELYLMENKPGAPARQITQSLSAEFKAYPWRDPQVITIRARDGENVYGRLYKPAKPNGGAVIFVHGAGYLQNAHKWWSNYFREYMFHNLLTDKGYTVLDIDYRGSAGYGRNWRTGIYRFMGGKDLTDHVDAASFLTEQHGVDAKRIGIYGGSYGGFITLMAMFTTPDVFAAGAALRPVTDWAHYNHPYTSNILNLPYTDSLAYAKSSPLYHAEGLKGSLLICHGMVDVNVHFQDVVRLSQRLIELGKDNWELAVYPMEDHGFVEPSSWTDEYKRILRLFERTLK